MTSKLTCPACGSDDVTSATNVAELALPFSEAVRVEEVVNTCRVCGTEGDFLDQNQARVDEALRVATRESVRQMIDGLGNQGVTMAYFERALRLPQRTLARWKTGECTASAIAVLRLVSTYPWLLSVAEASFDFSCAQQKLVEAASQVLAGAASRRAQFTPMAPGQNISKVSQVSGFQPSGEPAPTVQWYSASAVQR